MPQRNEVVGLISHFHSLQHFKFVKSGDLIYSALIVPQSKKMEASNQKVFG